MKKIILFLFISAFILKAEKNLFTLIYPIDLIEDIKAVEDQQQYKNILRYMVKNYAEKDLNVNSNNKYKSKILKILYKKENFEFDDLLNTDYKIIDTNINYNNESCAIYADYIDRSICYYSIEEDKIIHKIEYDKIREFYGSDKYVAAFNEDYKFDFYDINSAEKTLTLEPDSIITGLNLLIDKYFVMNHAGGFTVYDLETGKDILKYEASNIRGNNLIPKDDSTFYFINSKKLFLVDVKNHQVAFDLDIEMLSPERIYLNDKKMQFVFLQNDSTIIFDGAFSGEYETFNLSDAMKYHVFARNGKGLILGKNDELYQLSNNDKGETKLEFLKKIDFDKNDDKSGSFKEPGVDLRELQGNLVYPEMARKAGIEGFVITRGMYSKDGLIIHLHIIHPESSDIFFQSTSEAILKTDVSPAIENNKPIQCFISIPVRYKLR